MSTSMELLNEIQKIGLSYGYFIEKGEQFEVDQTLLKLIMNHFHITYEKSALLFYGIGNELDLERIITLPNKCAYQFSKMIKRLTVDEFSFLINQKVGHLKLALINRGLKHGITIKQLKDHDLFEQNRDAWASTYLVVECIIRGLDYQIIDYSNISKRNAYAYITLLRKKSPYITPSILATMSFSMPQFLVKALDAGIHIENLQYLNEMHNLTEFMITDKEVIDMINQYGWRGNTFFYVWFKLREESLFESFLKTTYCSLTDEQITLLNGLLEKESRYDISKTIPYLEELMRYDLSKIALSYDDESSLNNIVIYAFLLYKNTENLYLKGADFQLLIDQNDILDLYFVTEDAMFFENSNPIDIFKVFNIVKTHYNARHSLDTRLLESILKIIKKKEGYDYTNIPISALKAYRNEYEIIDIDIFLKIYKDDLLLSGVTYLYKINMATDENLEKLMNAPRERIERYTAIIRDASKFYTITPIDAYLFLDKVIKTANILKSLSIPRYCSLEQLQKVDFNQHVVLINKEIAEHCKSKTASIPLPPIAPSPASPLSPLALKPMVLAPKLKNK